MARSGPTEPPSPHFYGPVQQFYGPVSEIYFLVLTTGPPELAIPLLRRAVMETDANAAAFHAIPLAEYTQIATIGQKVAANLMGALGLTCLILAALGLYSVISCNVSLRVPEIGIRMAMGARPRDVIAMVVGQGMTLTLAGVTVGIVAALVATRLIGAMLFRVDVWDLATFTGAGLFLGSVALAATWLPAFRATRIDAMQALRKG